MKFPPEPFANTVLTNPSYECSPHLTGGVLTYPNYLKSYFSASVLGNGELACEDAATLEMR